MTPSTPTDKSLTPTRQYRNTAKRLFSVSAVTPSKIWKKSQKRRFIFPEIKKYFHIKSSQFWPDLYWEIFILNSSQHFIHNFIRAKAFFRIFVFFLFFVFFLYLYLNVCLFFWLVSIKSNNYPPSLFIRYRHLLVSVDNASFPYHSFYPMLYFVIPLWDKDVVGSSVFGHRGLWTDEWWDDEPFCELWAMKYKCRVGVECTITVYCSAGYDDEAGFGKTLNSHHFHVIM